MSIYLIIVASVLILGAMMPQKGRERIWYIALMTAIHAFVCAFRYEHLTGDLMKYHSIFKTLSTVSWFGGEVYNEGRNFGFYFLQKLVAELTNDNFQALLILIAVFSHLVLGYMIYRYSPAPWLSFLVWNCMALYVFTFSALKQTLAMAFVMLSYIGISKKKPLVFVVFMALAGMMHIPALVFIPAYWLTKIKVKSSTFVLYVVLSVLLYVFRQQFVNFISSLYYEDDQGYVYEGGVGNRFFMLAGFALLGAIFRGFADRDFERMFHLMVVSAILQMLAGFDHVFTRMSDYYFQFSVLYIPMTFVAGKRTIRNRRGAKAVLPFNKRSMKLLTAMIAVFMIWFYWKYSIGVDVAYSVDDYTNFRFMWDVK